MKLVTGIILNELSKRKQFAVNDVNRHLDIDSSRYLRLLVRVGFVEKAEAKCAGVANAEMTLCLCILPLSSKTRSFRSRIPKGAGHLAARHELTNQE